MIKAKVLFNISFSFLLLLHSKITAQNLIVNPSAESVPTSNGWTAVSTGTTCNGGSGWRMQGSQTGYPVAQSGSYFFNPGCGGTGTGTQYELYQNISVSANATDIDASAYTVNFSGYMHSFNQSPADETQIIVEYRNASNTVLSSYNTGTVTSTGGWTLFSNSRTAPVNTRAIRIRLIATSRNGNAIDSYFDNLSLTATSTLPVTFISFSVNYSATGNELKWQTSDEINNKGFNVERSSNGNTWQTIGFVKAAGTGISSLNQYRFTDVDPQGGINYYRLNQLDLDGNSTYSTVINVRLSAKDKTILFPNPANNFISIITKENNFTVEIINIAGKSVAIFNKQKNLDIQFLAKGMYYLKLIGAKRTESFKFLKN